MTTAERRALGAYVREAADMLGLIDWQLFLDAEPPDDVAASVTDGHCRVIFGQRTARIWLNVRDESPERVRYVVVHELLHIPMQAPWWVWCRPCEDQLGVSAYGAIVANAITVWEDTIDTLARAFAVLLPFVDWDAVPDPAWISDPDSDGTLVLYSRLYHQADRPRPV